MSYERYLNNWDGNTGKTVIWYPKPKTWSEQISGTALKMVRNRMSTSGKPSAGVDEAQNMILAEDWTADDFNTIDFRLSWKIHRLSVEAGRNRLYGNLILWLRQQKPICKMKCLMIDPLHASAPRELLGLWSCLMQKDMLANYNCCSMAAPWWFMGPVKEGSEVLCLWSYQAPQYPANM